MLTLLTTVAFCGEPAASLHVIVYDEAFDAGWTFAQWRRAMARHRRSQRGGGPAAPMPSLLTGPLLPIAADVELVGVGAKRCSEDGCTFDQVSPGTYTVRLVDPVREHDGLECKVELPGGAWTLAAWVRAADPAPESIDDGCFGPPPDPQPPRRDAAQCALLAQSTR